MRKLDAEFKGAEQTSNRQAHWKCFRMWSKSTAAKKNARAIISYHEEEHERNTKAHQNLQLFKKFPFFSIGSFENSYVSEQWWFI